LWLRLGLGLNFFRFNRQSFWLEPDLGRGFWGSECFDVRRRLNWLRFKRDGLWLQRWRGNLFG